MAQVLYERLNVSVKVEEDNISEVSRLEELGYVKVEEDNISKKKGTSTEKKPK